jgi:hypothetical protein
VSDLRERVPAQSLMQRTLELHQPGFHTPSGEALSWYTGALGEIAVAGVLGWLGDEWTVLHSVPVGEGDTDIDHVVIGPPGVFTINTKNHAGQKIWIGGHGLLVSGQKTNYIGLAAAEASRAERLLSDAAGLVVPVSPLIVLVNAGERTVKAAPEGGVRVVADWELIDALRSRRIFSDEQIGRIVRAAIRPETWRRRSTPPVDARRLSIQFNAIVARGLQGATPTPPQPVPAIAPSPHQVARPRGARHENRRDPAAAKQMTSMLAVAVSVPVAGALLLSLLAGAISAIAP